MLDQFTFCDMAGPDFAFHLTPAERDTLSDARAILKRMLTGRDLISSWATLTDYLTMTLSGSRIECARVLYLDRKNRLICDQETARGTVDHAPLYPREIVRRALELDASAIIIAHNHPSGDTTPSKGDVDMTKAIGRACNALGITLHDSVICGGAEMRSMRADGLL